MSSVSDPPLLKAKLIVVARSKAYLLLRFFLFALTLINFCCSLCSLSLTKDYIDFLLIGPLHEIIADNNGMSENDAKLMQVIFPLERERKKINRFFFISQIFAMNQLHQIEAMEFKLMRENQKPNSMEFPGNFQDDDYEY